MAHQSWRSKEPAERARACQVVRQAVVVVRCGREWLG